MSEFHSSSEIYVRGPGFDCESLIGYVGLVCGWIFCTEIPDFWLWK